MFTDLRFYFTYSRSSRWCALQNTGSADSQWLKNWELRRTVCKKENTEWQENVSFKGGSVIEMLVYNSQHTAKLEFCVYLFKNCPSQFLSHWESAEPVFLKKKSLTLRSWQENSNFAVFWELSNNGVKRNRLPCLKITYTQVKKILCLP